MVRFRLKRSLFFTLATLLVFVSKSHARWENLKHTPKIKKEIKKAGQVTKNINMYKKNNMLLQDLADRIKRSRIKGIELLVAAPTTSALESRFGHAMLRFVSRDEYSSGTDISISLVADINTPKMSYLKGIFGGYAVYPELTTFRELHERYIKHQNRQIDRYSISADKELINSLYKVIENYVQSYHSAVHKKYSLALSSIASKVYRNYPENEIEPIIDVNSGRTLGYSASTDKKIKYFKVASLPTYKSKQSKYTFFGRNCAGAIIDLFRKAGIRFSGKWSFSKRIPTKLPKYFYKNGLILLEKVITPGIGKLLSISSKRINTTLGPKPNKNQMNQIIENIQDIPLNDAYLLYDLYEWEDKQREIIVNYVIENRQENPPPKYDQLYKLTKMYWERYKFCTHRTCAFRLIDRNIYNYGNLVDHYKLRKHPWTKKIKEMRSNLIVYSRERF